MKVESVGNVFGEEGFNLDVFFDMKGFESYGKERVIFKVFFWVCLWVFGICFLYCYFYLFFVNNMVKM